MSAAPHSIATSILRKPDGNALFAWCLVAMNEMRALWRDGRFATLAAGVMVLAVAVGIAGVVEHAALERERGQAAASMRNQWEAQGDKHPHSAAHFGTYVFKPESPVAALDPGVRPFVGRTIWLEPHKRNPARFLPAQDSTLASQFPPLTFATLLQWLLPLLAIGASYSVVARERESGSLRLMLASGASAGQIVAGKFAGVAAAVLAVYGVVMSAAALAVGLSQDPSADDWIRMAGFAFAHGLLLLTVVAISVAVSACVAQPRAALLLLLVFWAINLFAAPRLATIAAERLFPQPAAEEFWRGIAHDIEHGLPGDGSARERLKKLEAKVLAQYKVAKLDELPVGFGGLRLRANDAYSEKVHDLHFGRLWQAYEEQVRVHLAASLAGPFAPVRSLSQAFAGTNLAHQQAFESAAESYRRYFVDYTSDKVAELGTGMNWNVKGSEALWKEIRDFGYTRPELRGAMLPRPGAIAWLALWCLLSVGALWMAARALPQRV